MVFWTHCFISHAACGFDIRVVDTHSIAQQDQSVLRNGASNLVADYEIRKGSSDKHRPDLQQMAQRSAKHNSVERDWHSRGEHYLHACILTITTSIVVMEVSNYQCAAKSNDCLQERHVA